MAHVLTQNRILMTLPAHKMFNRILQRYWLLLLIVAGVSITGIAMAVTAPPSANRTADALPPVLAQSDCIDSGDFPPIDDMYAYRQIELQVVVQGGAPLQNLCITALLDRAPLHPVFDVMTCRTDAAGRCTFTTPTGMLRLQMGHTIVSERVLDPAINKISTIGLGLQTDSLVFIIGEGNDPVILNLVAVARDATMFIIKNAQRDADGRIIVINEDVPDWAQQSP